MDFEKVLKEHYQENINEENLLSEAIATCEDYFDNMSEDEFLKSNRPLAIAYLALKQAERNKGT